MRHVLKNFFDGFLGRSQKMPEWVLRGELSATGAELRYWSRAGFSKGTDFYNDYLKLFEVSAENFAGKTVADFGSGPFGGILSILPDIGQGYPIDILADEYNKFGRSRFPVVAFDGGPTSVAPEVCDAVFCTNAIDHTPKPNLIAQEIFRILKPGGTVFAHLHLRAPEEVNGPHPFPWDEAKFRRIFNDFEILKCQCTFPDWVNGNQLTMLYATARKPS